MRRFRNLVSAHKRFSFGLWILVLVAVVAGAQWQLTGRDGILTRVLAASVKSTPAPTITSGPAAGSVTSSTSATFSYSDSEKGVTFMCGLDGAALSACATSGITYPVGAGIHAFVVAAQGVSPSPSTSRTWTVDVTAPPAPSISGGPENPTIDTTATFTFVDGEAGVTFECRLDGSAEACVSPYVSKKLSVGDHMFSVVAIDAAGNRSVASATWSWTVLINKAFGISGNAIGPLYPVDPSIPGTATALDLRISNPYNFSITVVTIGVSVAPSTACGPTNFAIQIGRASCRERV